MMKKVIFLALGGATLAVIGTAAAKYEKKLPVRTIAALSSEFPFAIQESPVKSAKIKEELSINCETVPNEDFTLADSSQVVMLKFQKCPAQIADVKNTTNGYQAHVFKNRFAHLSTDYIQLENGENIIEFQIRLNDGQKLNKKIKINRLASF